MDKNDANVLVSTIDSVVVYKNGARITRRGRVAVPAGASTVVVKKLPHDTDPSSVKVTGKASVKGKVVSVSIEEHYEKEIPPAEIESLGNALATLEREATALEKKLELQERHLEESVALHGRAISAACFPLPADAGKELEHVAVHGVVDPAPGAAVTGLASTIEAHIDASASARSQLQVALDKAREKVDVARKQLERARAGNKDLPFKQVLIDIEASAAMDFDMCIEHVVSRASWVPVYDVQLDEDAGKVTIAIVAAVSNATSEDWPGVMLVASSADLLPVSVVEPQPWILKEPQRLMYMPAAAPMKAKRSIAPGAAAPSVVMLKEEMVEAKPKPVVVPAATVGGSKGSVVTFSLPARVSVQHGAFKNNITLLAVSLEGKVEYFFNACGGGVIVQNRVVNGDLELLPGVARVFAGDTFVGETAIGSVLPGEEFVLGTRESYDLKIEKKLASRSTEKAGLGKGKVERSYTYTITVENLAGKRRELVVWDRIPHSDTELVKVVSSDVSPQPAEMRMGLYQWKLDLGTLPAKTTIGYSFTVSHDANVHLDTPLP